MKPLVLRQFDFSPILLPPGRWRHGRFTYRLTWEEIVRLYRLTLNQPAQNTRARYNICPTITIDTIVEREGKRELARMRWGLVPSWWSKPLKELKLATFNARAETVAKKPSMPRSSSVATALPTRARRLSYSATVLAAKTALDFICVRVKFGSITIARSPNDLI